MKEGIEKIKFFTFGCRLNTWETTVMKDHLSHVKDGNVAIFNTCSVTSEADRKAMQAIRKFKKNNPNSKILVTGCSAQIDPNKWIKMNEVNFVIGNKEKVKESFWKNFSFNKQSDKTIVVSDLKNLNETSNHLLNHFNYKTRSFLQIQNGCDHRCTFCIIPYGRGKSRSTNEEIILENINNALRSGIREIVLTGVDLTSWGRDLPEPQTLGKLLKLIFKKIPNLPRLRVSSLDPAEIDYDFMDALAENENLLPHLHLSIQHGDDLILKRMKRRHISRDVLNFVSEAKRRRPDVVFGADLIAGFPTETEDAHQNTLKLMKNAEITFAHVFPFSPRIGTPAAKMKFLSKAIIRRRANELRQLGNLNKINFLESLIGSKQKVLIEKNGIGYTSQFARVKIVNSNFNVGDIFEINISKVEGENLIGIT